VFVFSSLQLRFSIQSVSTILENEMIIVENVNGMGEIACDLNMNPISNLSNVESIHLKCKNNLLENHVRLIIQCLNPMVIACVLN
jgi:hypothetical protein